ncbi:MAG: toll/interleukin-1 receptor domain-containing protein [Bacteroidales bacterium]|nr:toll/interleukin-1 receptor domain-containing protein [Bacteroidales bacterium]
MKDIFVSFSKEDKNLSRKLVSKLEAEGYSCNVLPRDSSHGKPEDLIAESRIFILILSSGAEKSQQVSEQLKNAVENHSFIIPFKAGKIDNNLGIQYMLNELEWVDAFGDGFDEAYDILLEIIEEITEGKKTKSINKAKQLSETGGFELKKPHLYGIIGVLAVSLLYFAFFNNSGTKNTTLPANNISQSADKVIPDIVNEKLKPEEQKIVGSWKMTGYEDSRQMTPEERRVTNQNIEQMKQRVLLTFNADRSFARAGFTQYVQKGYWEYDVAKKKIYLIPENTNKKEEINIIDLTNKKMTFVVTESVEISPGKTEIVTTKLSFEKQ